jgi:chemotaxis protein MotB
VLAQDETGQKGDPEEMADPAATDASLYEVEKALLGGSGDAMEANPLLEHIRTRVTDEGLIIEVFDIEGSPLFDGPSTTPNPIFERLIEMIGRVLARTTNKVAVSGHLATGDVSFAGPDPWSLSADRAQLTRRLLVASGVGDARLDRVVGKADRGPVVEDAPRDPRNRRMEITLLRRF